MGVATVVAGFGADGGVEAGVGVPAGVGDAVRLVDVTLPVEVGTVVSGVLRLLLCWQPAASTAAARIAVKAIRLRVRGLAVIVTFFTASQATAIASTSTEVTVPAGTSAKWEAAAKFTSAPTGLCVLRRDS